MSKLIQFLCVFFGYILLTPAQAYGEKVSLRKERRRINKELRRGERVLHLPVELFDILTHGLREQGWHVEFGLGSYSSRLRDAYVR